MDAVPITLIGQALELRRPPLSAAIEADNLAAVVAQAHAQLAAGAHALDLNAGSSPAPGLTEAFVRATLAVRAACPETPLFLDCGDPETLLAALEAVPGPVVLNAIALGPAEPDPWMGRLLVAAAASAAGAVWSPRQLPANADLDALGAAYLAAMRMTALGLRGPAYFDCLAYPFATHPAHAWRSLTWLRALRLVRHATAPQLLVAVGNVGYGAPLPTRRALRHAYTAAAVGAGATALIAPVEDPRIHAAIVVAHGERAPHTPVERWWLDLAAAAHEGEPLPPAPPGVPAAVAQASALLSQ